MTLYIPRYKCMEVMAPYMTRINSGLNIILEWLERFALENYALLAQLVQDWSGNDSIDDSNKFKINYETWI